jgi:autotransporter-associated beta strand protein
MKNLKCDQALDRAGKTARRAPSKILRWILPALLAMLWGHTAGAQEFDFLWTGGLSGEWERIDNWDCGSCSAFPGRELVPGDVAVFAPSGRTAVSIHPTDQSEHPDIAIFGIRFDPGAPAYTISVEGDEGLTLSGFGITQSDPNVVQTISNVPGPNDGGRTQFFNNAAAASVHFNNFGATAANIFAGRMSFFNASSAANSTIINFAAADPNVAVGQTSFFATATAGSATIFNNGGEAIDRNGGFTEFNDGSNAGNATIGNHADFAAGAGPGATFFNNTTKAGTATITNDGAVGANLVGGFTTFFTTDENNPTSADHATIFNRGGGQNLVGTPPGGGGVTNFLGVSTAGDATINNDGGGQTSPGGSTHFLEKSYGGNAIITNFGAGFADATGGSTEFDSTDPSAPARAGSATINNNGGLVGNAPGGITRFLHNTRASGATINNNVGTGSNASGGVTVFLDSANADLAIIFNNGSSGPERQGFTQFLGISTAGNASITNRGGAGANSAGGVTDFRDNSTANNATITTQGGSGGGPGGATTFENLSNGGTARAITNGNGSFDISQRDSSILMLIGSIEGSGNYFLGNQVLVTGGNNGSTTVSGVLQDGGIGGGTGGALRKVGTGTLTLSGVNTYTGFTDIQGGTLLVNGSLASPSVSVNAGTLGGTGTIAGLVGVSNNATLAPGASAGTLTVGSIIFSNDSQLNYELGSLAGPSDLLAINGALTLDGVLNVTNLGGMTAGTYTAMTFTGALTNNGLTVGALPPGFSATIVVVPPILVVPGSVNLVVTGAPGPTPIPTATPPPGGTPIPSPTPGITATPTPGATPGATPTPPPSTTHAINLSTRMRVGTGDNLGIGGFILSGSGPKHLLLRAIGPSLSHSGVPDALADPVLELHGPDGFVTVTNDNWRDTQETEIAATGIPPTNDLESAIDATLAPGTYTAIVSGKDNTAGVALVEIYDLDQIAFSKLANLSTRAFVGTGDTVVIAGVLLSDENSDDRIIVRGLGPSLSDSGLSPVLADPTLELRDSDGALLISNNDWQDNAEQAAELTAAGLAPGNPLESGIAATLPPGLYTAVLAGLNDGVGLGLVEAYDLGPP